MKIAISKNNELYELIAANKNKATPAELMILIKEHLGISTAALVVKTAKELAEDESLEHPEKAYRRGYRDAILILSQEDSISAERLMRIFNWAFDGELRDWQDKIRDEEDPAFRLAPWFPV